MTMLEKCRYHKGSGCLSSCSTRYVNEKIGAKFGKSDLELYQMLWAGLVVLRCWSALTRPP